MSIKRYESNGRLSRVVAHNGILYLSGCVCRDVPDIEGQTRSLLRFIEDTLEKYGSDKRHILSCQIFLKDIIRDFAPMNAIWEAWVEKGFEPARATVQAKMASEELLIEIVVTAAVKQ
ncbi:MAG: RidA family protein [Deltaproteobacteria bacterium]|jgi:enamine deaminase RidA (YjgF/YER057c/UK114 family)|nr:RidA family protein [Deltaproteobacteria bacterium]